MRILVLTRGVPGCGKSTWIKENGLEAYTDQVSIDVLRNLYASPTLNSHGKITIDLNNDRLIWKEAMRIIEQRMQNGDLVVVDAAHATKPAISRYHNFCTKYRYRCFVVDFSDVPLEICKENNMKRDPWKIVPNSNIEKYFYSIRNKNEAPPSWAKQIKPKDFSKTFEWRITDFTNKWESIHYIGDIQGCYSALKEYFDKNPMSDKSLYVFTGNLLNRGMENYEVLSFFLSIYEKENVIILEGSEEGSLGKWALDIPFTDKEFRKQTLPQLTKVLICEISLKIKECKSEADIEELKKKVRQFQRKFQQLLYHSYHNKEILVTPGGLSTIPSSLPVISQRELIKGTGHQDENIDTHFLKNTQSNQFQIHGNRNSELLPCKINDRCFNLECGIEYGGFLRVVSLKGNDFTVTEIRNLVTKYLDVNTVDREAAFLNHVFISQLKKNKDFVKEKKLGNNISSFNFTEQAFHKRVWNFQTIRARGLFVNTSKYEVVARSYDKFFNLDEVPMTEYEHLKDVFVYPLVAYIKENGYLGILSGIQGENGTFELFCASKSQNEGPFAQNFKKFLMKHLETFNLKAEELAEYLYTNKVSVVFEVIIPDFDPHIIQYESATLVLLDVIHNVLTKFIRYDQKSREELAQKYQFPVKKLHAVLNSWDEFEKWHKIIIDPEFKFEGKPVEGIVLEDANHFMVKFKLSFYRMWKNARKFKEILMKGQRVNMKNVERGIKDFVEWMINLDKEDLKQDIITLRNKYDMIKQQEQEDASQLEENKEEEN